MRGKHKYVIKRISYLYDGEWFDNSDVKKVETILHTCRKRDEAERFYHSHLYLECGCEYKGCYYPYVEIQFVKLY